MTETKERHPIFLNNGNIVGFNNSDTFAIVAQKGIAIPREYRGMNRVDARVGTYHVLATASKFMADVARVKAHDRYDFDGDRDKMKTHPEIIFSGNLAIYHWEEIPETKVEGLILACSGEIWTGRKPSEDLENSNGLGFLILGNSLGNAPEIVQRRLQRIIAGYDIQARAENERVSKQRHEAYRQATADTREEIFGTFGRGW